MMKSLFYKYLLLPKSPHRNTKTAQTLDSTEKEKIAAEPMGATNVFCFSCETNILHIISRFYVGIWVLILLFISPFTVIAKAQEKDNNNLQQVYELQYIEREQGVDEYETTMFVTDRYIRIDEVGDDSGFIIYDDKNKIIHSVSHNDQSILIIKQHVFTEKDSPVKHELEYLQLADAPTISGHNIFNYRVYTGDENEETCTEIQLVENLLPEVTGILKNYQMIVSGQQVKMTDNKINDMQTACYFIDQIYNTGKYYEKGLPVQEWHSNERSRILTSYKENFVSRGKFTIPENYRQFSIDNNSKTFID